MNTDLIPKLEHHLKAITSSCPQIATFISVHLEPLDLDNGAGLYSNLGQMDEQWMSSTGYRQFAMADQSEGFVCLGLQNRDGVEYLYIMWVKEEKKFWFYDLIDDSIASIERINNGISLALQRWETSTYDVLYLGPERHFKLLGFYSPG